MKSLTTPANAVISMRARPPQPLAQGRAGKRQAHADITRRSSDAGSGSALCCRASLAITRTVACSWLLVAVCLPLIPRMASAVEDINPGYVDNAQPWKEMAASLPAYPKDENLVPFNVSSATPNRFMIDTASLSVGSDQVVRYTIVIESPRGARTVNFEGMRCDPAEYKIYAFGQTGGRWSENKRAAWEPFKQRSLLSYHKALFEDHFCANGLTIHDAKEGVRNLKRGGAGGLY
jgi:hypothetical protein